jgi:hypothetical protein
LVLTSSSIALADDIGRPGATDGPPVGIASAPIKLQSVFDANDSARGGMAHKSITDVETGTITAYGLTGRYRDVYAGLHSADDFRRTLTVGPFTVERGRYQGQRWRRDENGVTNIVQDTVRADENDARGFIADTENPKNNVKLLGEVTLPVDAYVVQVSVKNQAPFWSFFDKKTGLLDRVEIGYSDGREIFTYDDYRNANGIKEAWHTHQSDDNPQNTYDSRITSDTYSVAVSDQDLAIPSSRPNFVKFPAGKAEVDLPSDISFDPIPELGVTIAEPLIRVTVNGRGLDMLLDSKESGMVIDDEVAKELGLTTYGPYYKDDKGRYYPSRSVIASLNIGDLQMQNVAVSCEPVSTREKSGAKAVGKIGFDFLANAAVEIDYIHSSIKAFDPIQFVPPDDSSPSPINIDDGIPFVAAQVGNSIGDHFLLDTTDPFTELYPNFWQAHADDVKDQGQGRALNNQFFDSKDSAIKATQLQIIYFGGTRFTEWTAYEFTKSDFLEGVNVDGSIGYDFLQYFNVFLDYPQHQIFLEKNDAGKRAEHH